MGSAMVGVTMAAPLAVRACLLLARLFEGRLARYGTQNQRQLDTRESCVEDRLSVLPTYAALFKPFGAFEGKTVLELGCSQGHLLAGFLETEGFRAIGVDKAAPALTRGRDKYGHRIEFVQSTDETIPLRDASCDIAYTVDTVEHLSQPEAILLEMHRILRPGGHFLIHFHPWWGPYAAHLSQILPFPWPQVFFPMDTLMTAAAIRYDDPGYRLPFYRLDANGKKVANPYLEDWHDYLNTDMTIRGFRRLLKRLPFRVRHFQRIGFGGKTAPLARLARPLAQVPGLDEFFTSAIFCVLQKAGSSHS